MLIIAGPRSFTSSASDDKMSRVQGDLAHVWISLLIFPVTDAGRFETGEPVQAFTIMRGHFSPRSL